MNDLRVSEEQEEVGERCGTPSGRRLDTVATAESDAMVRRMWRCRRKRM
jgi:hypothetical protein